MLCERHYQEKDKRSQGLGENIGKRHIWYRTIIQNIQRIVKLNNKKTNNLT